MAWYDLLFYALFICQIFVISRYFPNRILDRMTYVLEHYPARDYPQLYPRSEQHYRDGHRRYRLINRAIEVFGFALMLALIFLVDHGSFADDGYISEAWPAFLGLIQMVPLIILQFSEFTHFKEMRAANADTRRKAELRPRRLFDFVSPWLLALALILVVVAIGSHAYADPEDIWIIAGSIVLGNGVMGAMVIWQVYGRKIDPHQDTEDRHRQIRSTVVSSVCASLFMSAYLIFAAADKLYDLDFLDAAMMSFYFQGVVILSVGLMLNGMKLEDINFDVYRGKAATP